MVDQDGDAPMVVDLAEDVLRVSGDVDRSTASEFRRALLATAAPTVDLTEVRYLDSAGIGVLFELAPPGLRLRVRAGSAVARVLDISGLSRVATVNIETG
jgi:anti-sigma B factor antagonist